MTLPAPATTPTPSPTLDARNLMVDGQLRPNKVTDKRVLAAMRRLPREAFLPAVSRPLAYVDNDVPVLPGRGMLAPVAIARLVQALAPQPGQTALVLGASYGAALLAALDLSVIALEDDAAMADLARAGFAAAGLAVDLRIGPLAPGLPEAAPFDLILVDGGVTRLPALALQLRIDPPGRLAAVLCPPGRREGVATLAERAGAALAARPLFDCAATCLPACRASAAFHFA